MKKTAAATKPKTTKAPTTVSPATEPVTPASQPKKATRGARKAQAAKPATKKASPKKVAAAKTAGTSKKAAVIALIGRKNGASLDEIMTATGWQKHTVRGFISILGKAGTKVESSKSEAGARTYRVA